MNLKDVIDMSERIASLERRVMQLESADRYNRMTIDRLERESRYAVPLPPVHSGGVEIPQL